MSHRPSQRIDLYKMDVLLVRFQAPLQHIFSLVMTSRDMVGVLDEVKKINLNLF